MDLTEKGAVSEELDKSDLEDFDLPVAVRQISKIEPNIVETKAPFKKDEKKEEKKE